jgi:hypothetical protein
LGCAESSKAAELSRLGDRSPTSASSDGASNGWELSELAGHFRPQPGPTKLYINFDGWLNFDGKGNVVIPFTSAIPGQRDRDIQEILYRVAEEFAPFNVQVARMFGNGRHDQGPGGNATIFIGAQTTNLDEGGRKYQHFYSRGRNHLTKQRERDTTYPFVSAPYHLAFLDPVGQRPDSAAWVNIASLSGLSRAIAHEAGHCWGLVHVHGADLQDFMNYDDATKQFAFLDRTFPSADLNFDPKAGKMAHVPLLRYRGETIASQNSYRFLMKVLGPRPLDDHPNVANSHLVDAAYSEGAAQDLFMDAPVSGEIAPRGDYDVFRIEPGSGGWLDVEVKATAGSKLKPVILVFDGAGDRLLTAGGVNAKDKICRARWQAAPGKGFKVVVGAVDGSTTGGYQLVLRPTGPLPHMLAAQTAAGAVRRDRN